MAFAGETVGLTFPEAGPMTYTWRKGTEQNERASPSFTQVTALCSQPSVLSRFSGLCTLHQT